MNWKILLIAIVLIPTKAFALVGNDLYNWVQKEDMRVVAISYIAGYMSGEYNHTAIVLAKTKTFEEFKKVRADYICFPDKVTTDQVADIFQNYAKEHPEKRHLDAGVLIHNALIPIWGCAVQK